MGLELVGDVSVAPPRARVSGETALVGIYEISKLLASPARLENVLAGVLTLLSSFLDMRHGLIALLDDKGAPRLRQVRLGTAGDESAVEVLAGLRPGELVATDGALFLNNTLTTESR